MYSYILLHLYNVFYCIFIQFVESSRTCWGVHDKFRPLSNKLTKFGWQTSQTFKNTIENSQECSWRVTATPQNDRRPCEDCPVSREYSPVCGTNGITYQNMGQLQCASRCGVAVELQREAPCSTNGPSVGTVRSVTTTTISPFLTTTRRNEVVEECIRKCPSTPEYNPVCGTNHVTYNNPGKLRCARICGVDVHLWRHSPCPPNPTSTTTTVAPTTRDPRVIDDCIANCPTTPEYSPVCGTNDETYYNIGKLNCAKSCGVDVAVQNPGRCSFVPNGQQFANFGHSDYDEDNFHPRSYSRHQKYHRH